MGNVIKNVSRAARERRQLVSRVKELEYTETPNPRKLWLKRYFLSFVLLMALRLYHSQQEAQLAREYRAFIDERGAAAAVKD